MTRIGVHWHGKRPHGMRIAHYRTWDSDLLATSFDLVLARVRGASIFYTIDGDYFGKAPGATTPDLFTFTTYATALVQKYGQHIDVISPFNEQLGNLYKTPDQIAYHAQCGTALKAICRQYSPLTQVATGWCCPVEGAAGAPALVEWLKNASPADFDFLEFHAYGNYDGFTRFPKAVNGVTAPNYYPDPTYSEQGVRPWLAAQGWNQPIIISESCVQNLLQMPTERDMRDALMLWHRVMNEAGIHTTYLYALDNPQFSNILAYPAMVDLVQQMMDGII